MAHENDSHHKLLDRPVFTGAGILHSAVRQDANRPNHKGGGSLHLQHDAAQRIVEGGKRDFFRPGVKDEEILTRGR